MYALNFYSPMVADQLRSGRKTATIRLGDKSRKYRKGMIVQVLAGTRFSPRQKIFDAVIDKVEVKTLADLSPREIEHDNPEIRRPEEMAGFLGQLYNREIGEDAVVTVIRFSEIKRESKRPRANSARIRALRCTLGVARASSPDSGSALLGATDPHAELLRRAELGAAGLALDGKRGAEARVAGRATGADLAVTLRARGRQLVLELVEVALRKATGQAEGHPVAEGLAALLTQPVGSLAHAPTVSPERSLELRIDGNRA